MKEMIAPENKEPVTTSKNSIVKSPRVPNLVIVGTIIVAMFLILLGLRFVKPQDKSISSIVPPYTVTPTSTVSNIAQISLSATPSISPNSTIRAESNGINIYVNNQYGFSIELPATVFRSNCSNNMVQVKLVPIETSNSVHIMPEQLSKYDDAGNCKEETASIATSPDFLEWDIQTTTVNNDTDIANYIKQLFGSSCALWQKTATNQAGTYDIIINDTDQSCVINAAYAFKYSPTFHKIAVWSLGQDLQFYKSSSGAQGDSYDSEMAASFKFN